ncbi:UNVERIFIED_CONTAM: hypothetical protein Slati_3593800 [Sesamum latifolium]|uniref:Uncharacterized protein n=1 Tax=Sesamum latifolium TaxID=2727402 RepID=A0AAW2U2N3_9LAMI
MKAVVDEKKDKVTIRAECRADEGRKHVEKVELKTHDVETVKYVERKLVDKGVGRLERHPADGLPLKHDPKKGHGGKYTWEGPEEEFEAEAELEAEAAIDEKDPNYVEEEMGEEGSDELVVGEVEVAKAAEEGVARIEVDPHLKVN